MTIDEPSAEHAQRAGWRYAMSYPGDVFVLRHSGIRAGKWRLAGHHEAFSDAEQMYLELRGRQQFGALAIWQAGKLPLFEQFQVESLVGKYGPVDR